MQGQAAGKSNLECLSKMMEMEYSRDWRKQFASSPTGTRAEKLNLNRVILKKGSNLNMLLFIKFFCFAFLNQNTYNHSKIMPLSILYCSSQLSFWPQVWERWRFCFRKEVQQTLSPWTLSWLTPRWKTLIWVVSSVKLVHYNHKKPTLVEPWYYDSPWQPATKKLSRVLYAPQIRNCFSSKKREIWGLLKKTCSWF